MALIPQEELEQNYWQHQCEVKENAVVYTPRDQPCFICGKTEAETKAD